MLLVVFTVIRFLAKPGGGFADSFVDRTIWAWLGLILSIVIVVGAWANMRAAGESLGDVRDKLASGAAAASSAAKSATTSDETPAAAPAAPSTEAAPMVETITEEAPPAAETMVEDVTTEAGEAADAAREAAPGEPEHQ